METRKEVACDSNLAALGRHCHALLMTLVVVDLYCLFTVAGLPDLAVAFNLGTVALPFVTASVSTSRLCWVASVALCAIHCAFHVEFARLRCAADAIKPDRKHAHAIRMLDSVPMQRLLLVADRKGWRRLVGAGGLFPSAVALFVTPAALLWVYWKTLIAGVWWTQLVPASAFALSLFVSIRPCRMRSWRRWALCSLPLMPAGATLLVSSWYPIRGLPSARALDARGLDLSHADLHGVDLTGAILRRTLAEAANLDGANLMDGDLATARLSGAQLRSTHFERADLAGADLSAATAHGAWFNEAQLNDARLNRIDLRNAHLEHADLSGTVLFFARLSDAIFDDAVFRDTTLSGATLQGAHLKRARLEGAELSGQNMKSAIVHDAWLSGARMASANLESAELRGSHMPRADLTSAHLERADLTSVDLTEADLRHANLTGAKLDDTVLKDADLRGTLGLTQHQLDRARCGVPRLSEHLTPPSPCQ
jgi:uncharacterized protein YjbI with pentapeptide repeats